MPAIITNFNGTYIEHVEQLVQHNGTTVPNTTGEQRQVSAEAEDVAEIDTSFFCTKHFTPDIIEKNIHQAIEFASSKADACRRLMSLETSGYVILSNVTDDRKAALLNPFASPKYTFTGEDFKKSRNRPIN